MLPDWSELIVVAILALIVVGPKDLPRMIRAIGRIGGYIRGLADEFRRSLEELEREVDRQEMLEDAARPAPFAPPVDPTGGEFLDPRPPADGPADSNDKAGRHDDGA